MLEAPQDHPISMTECTKQDSAPGATLEASDRLRDRLEPIPFVSPEPERIPQAAVTLILWDRKPDLHLLIIKRAQRPGDPWSGHLALPGGRSDPEDLDLVMTAARETREEVGIDLIGDQGDRRLFLGRLPALTTRSPRLPLLEIVPFVATLPGSFVITPNHEVESAFWVSLRDLKARGHTATFPHRTNTLVRKWPAYETEAGPIWGITERILTDLLSRLHLKELT
jgi:8-oxo-dGTP pyrophosphatase MutT (NUDIX family)